MARRSFFWRRPRSAQEIVGRSVSFLELFYDLVYVVIIAQLAHSLAHHVTLATIGSFIFLFVLVWWAWINGAIYHNLHGYDDVRNRTYTFIQMGIICAMAIFAHDAMGETSRWFALAYATFMALYAFLWWRTGVHDPGHRPQTIPYIITYPIAVVIFIASIFVPPPVRYIMWGAAIAQVLLVTTLFAALRRNMEYISGVNVTSPSFIERFKLFTIIVFGETIVAVVAGLSRLHHFNLSNGLLGALGLILAFGLWWIYFDFSERHPVKPRAWFLPWIYIHLPLSIGITAIGPSVLNIIVHEGEVLPVEVRWLMTGAIALSFFSIGVYLQTLDVKPELKPGYRTASILLFGMSAAAVVLGFLSVLLSPLILLISLPALLVIPIAYGLYLRWKVPPDDE